MYIMFALLHIPYQRSHPLHNIKDGLFYKKDFDWSNLTKWSILSGRDYDQQCQQTRLIGAIDENVASARLSIQGLIPTTSFKNSNFCFTS